MNQSSNQGKQANIMIESSCPYGHTLTCTKSTQGSKGIHIKSMIESHHVNHSSRYVGGLSEPNVVVHSPPNYEHAYYQMSSSSTNLTTFLCLKDLLNSKPTPDSTRNAHILFNIWYMTIFNLFLYTRCTIIKKWLLTSL